MGCATLSVFFICQYFSIYFLYSDFCSSLAQSALFDKQVDQIYKLTKDLHYYTMNGVKIQAVPKKLQVIMMEKKLLMGNEAIAFGAMRAGVQLVSGYPGTPSTEVLETVAKYNKGDIYVEWSVNEKCALEVAAGAAYAGARAMVTMKQVGLNVASDPLMSLNYVGVKGGLVIVVADDPGPISSQTEQDTRHFGKFAKLTVFDPSSPEEAYIMIADAFEHSKKYGLPVLFRSTTRISHGCASIGILDDIPQKTAEGFIKNARWVIFPRLAYANHIQIEEKLKTMSREFSHYPANTLTISGTTETKISASVTKDAAAITKGIVSGGVSYAYTAEALENISKPYQLLKISTYPFPQELAKSFLENLEEVLVVEELDPVIEQELIHCCGQYNLNVKIKGKLTGDMPNAGENTVDGVSNAIRNFLQEQPLETKPPELPPLPVRPPVLCAGCPHRASFFAVKEAMKGKKAVFSGDIGCYTLGNAMPLDMVDTCLCMGAGITVAQGLHRIEPDTANFAFVGDSTFFHSGITGIINAVYNQTDIIVVILDNSTTAMTGNQPHPGIGLTMMGTSTKKISIRKIVEALDVTDIVCVDPLDLSAAKTAVHSVLDKKGVRIILFESPCIAVTKRAFTYQIDKNKCTRCKICIRKLGCPAIVYDEDRVSVNPALCSGCGICAQVCAVKAIGGESV